MAIHPDGQSSPMSKMINSAQETFLQLVCATVCAGYSEPNADLTARSMEMYSSPQNDEIRGSGVDGPELAYPPGRRGGGTPATPWLETLHCPHYMNAVILAVFFPFGGVINVIAAAIETLL